MTDLELPEVPADLEDLDLDEQGHYTIDQLKALLGVTEPLGVIEFQPDGDEKLEFTLPSGWNNGLKDRPGDELTDAKFSVQDTEYALTKDAALQATSLIGLTRDYVQRTPGPMVNEHLNYWMSHLGGRSFNFLTTADIGLAITKGQANPISNLEILEAVQSKLVDRFGPDTEIVADLKFHHDIRMTQFRLVVKGGDTRKIESPYETTEWQLGLDVQNSLTAEKPLRVRGFLTYGDGSVASTHVGSGAFSRKGNPTSADGAEFIAEAVGGILDGLPHELDVIAGLPEIDITDEVTVTLQDIFTKYKMPGPAREGIIARAIDSDDPSMYGILRCIAAEADNKQLSPDAVARVLEIAGDLPSTATDRCKHCHRLPVA